MDLDQEARDVVFSALEPYGAKNSSIVQEYASRMMIEGFLPEPARAAWRQNTEKKTREILGALGYRQEAQEALNSLNNALIEKQQQISTLVELRSVQQMNGKPIMYVG